MKQALGVLFGFSCFIGLIWLAGYLLFVLPTDLQPWQVEWHEAKTQCIARKQWRLLLEKPGTYTSKGACKIQVVTKEQYDRYKDGDRFP